MYAALRQHNYCHLLLSLTCFRFTCSTLTYFATIAADAHRRLLIHGTMTTRKLSIPEITGYRVNTTNNSIASRMLARTRRSGEEAQVGFPTPPSACHFPSHRRPSDDPSPPYSAYRTWTPGPSPTGASRRPTPYCSEHYGRYRRERKHERSMLIRIFLVGVIGLFL